MLRGLELNLTRPLGEVAEEIIAEDVVGYDRRRVISAPTLHGREAYLENVEALYGQFGTAAGETVAVRDARLALVRLVFGREGGFQQSVLSLFELDEAGRISRQVTFEEDDFNGAFAELDERFTVFRTDAPGPAEIAVGYLIGAFHLNGLHEAHQVYRDDFVAVDHRPLGFPPATFEEFRERALVGKEMTPDFKGYGRLRFFDDRAILTVVMFAGTTAEGNRYTWDLYHLFQTDEQGKVARLDYFPEDRWADAMAAFEQARGAGAVGNAVTRVLRAGWGLSNTGDLDGAEAYLSPEVELLDQRTGVSMPTLTGVNRVREILDATYEVFDTITFDVLAVRGDRVALIRMSCTTTDGFVVTSLNVVEADDDHLMSRMMTFDESDLAAAVEELDARWRVIAGAASADEEQLSNRAADLVAEMISAFETRDWDWYADRFADDVINDDRRTGVNSGRHVGGERIVDLTRSLADVGFTSVSQTPIAVRGERLVLLERTFHNPDGFDLDVLALAEIDEHDRTCRNTLFDPDDLPAALAELDERFAVGEGVSVAAYVRQSAEFWRLYNARAWGEVLDYLGAGWVAVDHRLASAGTIQSAPDFVAYAQGMTELVPDLVAYEDEYLLLGARCGLSRVVARGTSTEGAEVDVQLLALGVMVDGALVRCELFGVEHLDQATARFHEIESSSPS